MCDSHIFLANLVLLLYDTSDDDGGSQPSFGDLKRLNETIKAAVLEFSNRNV